MTGYSDDGKSSTYGSAYLFDELSFSEDSGIFRIGMDISGSISLTSDHYADGNASLDLATYDLSGFRTPHEVFDHTRAFRSDLGIYVDDLVGSYGMSYVDIAFTDSYLKLDAVLTASVRCILFVTAPDCDASTDFMSTVVFTGGSILDSSGSVIGGATMTSASGTDYTGGRDEPALVPLPPTMSMMLLGMGFFGLARHRRRQRRVA